MSYTSGGKGANQAIAIGKMAGKCEFLACLGNDYFADKILESLKESKVNTSNIKYATDCPSGLAMVCLDSNGDNLIIVNSNANKLLDIAYLNEKTDLIEDCQIIVLQNEIDEEIIKYILLTYGDKKEIVFNAAPCPNYLNDLYLSKITYLLVNENEAKELASLDSDDYYQNASILLRRGVKNLIITLGSKGSMFFSNHKSFLIRPYQVEAIDTVGAGDTFIGAFVVGLLNESNHFQALDFASCAAALTCLKSGASKAIPTLSEVEIFKEKYNEKNNN